MVDEKNIHYRINPTWNIIEEITTKIDEILEGLDINMINASKMTAAELIENAVKYGSLPDKEEQIEFDLSILDSKVIIKVSNYISSLNHYENIKEHIIKINNSKNPKDLYVIRLNELMNNPKPGESMLGLYRIAYEGEFKLNYEFKNNIITFYAEREI